MDDPQTVIESATTAFEAISIILVAAGIFFVTLKYAKKASGGGYAKQTRAQSKAQERWQNQHDARTREAGDDYYYTDSRGKSHSAR